MKTLDQLVSQFTASIPSDIPSPEPKCGNGMAVFDWSLSPNKYVIVTVLEDAQIIMFYKGNYDGILDLGQSEPSNSFPPKLESMIRDILQDGVTQ